MTKILTIFISLLSGSLFGQAIFLDSIHHNLRKLDGSKRVEQLYTLASQNMGDHPAASIQLAEERLQLSASLANDSLTIEGILLLGDLYDKKPDHTRADSLYTLANTMARESGNQKLITKTIFAKAEFYGSTGQWAEANSLLDEVYKDAVAHHDSLTEARSMLTKGVNYEKMSSYEKALECYYHSLKIYQNLHNRFREGITRTNIGMCFLRLNRYPESLIEFQTAYHISELENDKEGLLINALNIGVVHQKTGAYALARKSFEASLVTARAMNSWYDIALLTANLGTISIAEKKYEEAKKLLERAVVIKDSLGLQHDMPHTLISLADANLKLGLYEEALLKANEASRLAEKYNVLDQLSDSHRILAEIYAAMKNFPMAYEHSILYKKISDSVYTIESDQSISNLKIQYETSMKENQIAKLTDEYKRNKTTKFIFLAIGILVLITGASLVYALYQKRTRDSLVITRERELHEMQNHFFANISHEFRTPLTLILGPLQKLRQHFRGIKEEESFRTIQKNAERLLHLINQILDLTKLDRKALELKKEWFHATMIFQGITSSFDSIAESRHIHYNYEFADAIILHGDSKRLEIVLINLISNAFKFTPDGGSIDVSGRIDEAAKTFQLEVRDTGRGIAEENLSKIFDRYFHDDREAHSDFEGVGIGLALSKNIVDMHGGKISVATKLNEGSTFTIILPYEEVPHNVSIDILEDIPESLFEIESSETTKAEKNTKPGSHKHKPILLLVEDRKDMRQYISSILHKDYQVIEAENAVSGMAQALEHIPDIVISDVMMPGKSGLEFCRDMKTDARTSHIPVILLTARSSIEDRISGLETEADVYLTKPFIPEELELQLRNLITSRRKIRGFYEQHRRIEPAKMSFNSVDEKFLEEFVAQLEANYKEETFSVEQLADLMNLSRSQLHRKISALTGQSPNKLIRTYRLKKAYDMISSRAAGIAEISFQTGFNSPAYFTKCFEEEFGCTPSELKNKSAVDSRLI